ncbi:GntP family permease [Synoicihabitans lomoniglobus]|uniref:GntP family permease n=1 Tax=Synoicihabitans lomoniglobus TaxID=2909285 RepID=A0AAF0A0L6_9BACT|nr:GntP family permease [Opitutaceae bacterium LMO-M01]WED64312.1 GntP family permease [Opitutaceae bacterium LMO-M01]
MTLHTRIPVIITPIILLLLAIAFIVVATTRWKLPPFLTLLIGAGFYGLASGLSAAETLAAITGGLGKTVGGIGIVIACGCVIGAVLERTGAAMVMAQAVLRVVGRTRAVLAMGLTGGIVSVPVFCDSGYVVLAPLVRGMARGAKQSVAALAVALSMGLYVTHCLVPPTPGPVAAAEAVRADLGRVIGLGLLVAAVVIGVVCWFAVWAGRRWPIELAATETTTETAAVKPNVSVAVAFAPIVLPMMLIAWRSFFPGTPGSDGAALVAAIGHPNVALMLGALLALVLARREGATVLGEWSGEAMRTAGAIVLVTGAGGALGAVLRATPLADVIATTLSSLDLGRWNIVLPFLVAAGLKTAQGSSTVAIVTTASLIAPLLGVLGLDQPTALALTVLAIGAGAMTVSHVNDSYFWVVTQLTGLSVAQGYRLVTLASGIAGLTGIATIVMLRFVLG